MDSFIEFDGMAHDEDEYGTEGMLDDSTIVSMGDGVGDPKGRKLTDSVTLSVDEIAKYLGVSHMTVRRWIIAGHLEGFRVGPRMYRVREEKFQEFMDRGGVPAPERKPKGTPKPEGESD
jgi:excisionase family DNA binding protein